jgi:hypothetical protein
MEYGKRLMAGGWSTTQGRVEFGGVVEHRVRYVSYFVATIYYSVSFRQSCVIAKLCFRRVSDSSKIYAESERGTVRSKVSRYFHGIHSAGLATTSWAWRCNSVR